jgi:hypothetical protein
MTFRARAAAPTLPAWLVSIKMNRVFMAPIVHARRLTAGAQAHGQAGQGISGRFFMRK